ncbi:phytoene/squalene synthase family protein [Variovorax sp. J22R133]|uniref:phytoene/squalene synthase family protein n=1 Tax=Variovorax brevis TaxID=3053503 RepID=UPI00257527A5|nr:phytoene/squalene synthase family protein [Variovorax sp. J22R133]MDM0113786.1 phytoene/squalene synthase family protein [Variovorax sp. J22R133]
MQIQLPVAALHDVVRAQDRTRIEPADIAACRASLRQGSRTFLAASLLLPREVRDAACALYAFCRMADDAVDDGDDEQGAVEMLRHRLARAYDRAAPIASIGRPCDRALAAVVAHFDIPRALPEAMIEGFQWDVSARRYESFEELCEYAARVAGAVGAMMALLMGVRSADGVARACDLGVAMQLSNIARDVGEDAAMGRLYLPREWMREAGMDPEAWLARPAHTPALGSVICRLLKAADVLYRRVDAGVAELPLACRPGINAARFLYADIGWVVEKSGFDSIAQRAVVPASRKAWSLARALLAIRPRRAAHRWPVLPANRFLVEAVAETGPQQQQQLAHVADGRVVWLIDLFDRLERQERARAIRPPMRA